MLEQKLKHISKKLERVIRDFLKEHGLPEDITIRIEVPTDTYEVGVTIEAEGYNPEELTELELELMNILGRTGLEMKIERLVSAYVYELDDETVLLEKPMVVLVLE